MSVRLPEAADLQAAAARLSGRVRRTPVLELDGTDLGVSGRVLLKLELTQHTGSFKARGAMNSLLAATARRERGGGARRGGRRLGR